MKKIIENLTAKGAENLEEASFDNKKVYSSLKVAISSAGSAVKALKLIPPSKWGKANKKESREIDDLIVKLNQIKRDATNLAIGVGVTAGR